MFPTLGQASCPHHVAPLELGLEQGSWVLLQARGPAGRREGDEALLLWTPGGSVVPGALMGCSGDLLHALPTDPNLPRGGRKQARRRAGLAWGCASSSALPGHISDRSGAAGSPFSDWHTAAQGCASDAC